MESMKLQSDQLLDEVYLVARGFNLGALGIGLKLYVDPAGLRRKGQLRFAADNKVNGSERIVSQLGSSVVGTVV
ncbi:hypothetical protein BPOR_0422g00040 [Botrytis porri]|uniref:Uncharacterized protein n=1 Tax=Botrytis porri TaxID=87229 RepID=A0A4Z1KIM2_9HELO|nr:hypothetical protein BPOR_0422g00040 [Botrytis porri]